MKENLQWNPEEEALLRRPVEALRQETGNPLRMQAAEAAMLDRRTIIRPRRPMLRYAMAGAAVLALSVVALWPRPVSASLKNVIQAVKAFPARYERVYRPDAGGNLKLAYQEWSEPGKHATYFEGSSDFRNNGVLNFVYDPGSNYQRISPAPKKAMEMDSVAVEDFKNLPYSKLLRVEQDGPFQRYVFQMGATRQDLVVESESSLPRYRDVFYPGNTLLERHEYHFSADLPDEIFDPKIRPGVPMVNIVEQRARLAKMLEDEPQVQIVAGQRIALHAVIVSREHCIAAILSGEDARSASSREGIQVVGIQKGFTGTDGASSVWAGKDPRVGPRFMVKDFPGLLERTFYPPNVEIPDEFVLRVPVWKLDPGKPLLDSAGKKVGIDSKLVGWAEFKVQNAVYTDSVDAVLPGYEPSGEVGVAKAEG